MPSTVVHVAFAGLLAAALLGWAFDRRSLLVVLAATAVIDLDTVMGLYVEGAHRAAFHTLLLPLVAGAVFAWDVRREDSFVRGRWGAYGVRTGWVTLAAVTFAGIGPDLFTNGVNVLYPVHDAYYRIWGELLLSSQRGVVQTFVDLSALFGPEAAPSQPAMSVKVGTTENLHYSTGVDVKKGPDPADAERVFPVVATGMQALIVLMSGVAVGARLWETENA